MTSFQVFLMQDECLNRNQRLRLSLKAVELEKSWQRSLTSFELSRPRLTCVGPDDLWNA